MIIALLALPLLGSVLLGLLALRPAGSTVDRLARWLPVLLSGGTLGVAIALLPGTSAPAGGRVVDPRHEIDVSWVASLGVRFHVGVDGVSVPLVVLTALLTLLCTVYTVRTLPAPGRAASFGAVVLLLEAGLLGTFVALDLVLFFVAFEVVLAPMYFLIAVWGGGERARHAAGKFILYTLLGSVLVLVGIATIYSAAGTFDLVELSQRGGSGIARGTQIAAFLALFLGFAVKSPLWPLHTWLPDAHTEAPTVGSVLLAGVLLKMGTYGLVRVALPVLPEGARTLAPALGVLAVAGIIVGSLCCLAQTDVKRLVAYSSVGHMGFVLLGIATLTPVGVNAALLGNIAHGLITGLLFFLVGGVKDRYHTADLAALGGGLAERQPRLGGLLAFGCVASLGLPGLAGFWGEAFALLAAYRPAAVLSRPLFAVLLAIAAVGTAITTAYFLRLLRQLVLGPTVGTGAGTGPGAMADAHRLELVAWAPLVLLTVLVGLYPRLVLGLTEAPVRALLEVYGR
ncbi:MAG TPA: NADH-quinone oxidoreductase subunit M [Mycobacteriales bacterium]|nr:NADH-quinone oxidoreductase subunit M [Mycobacteriales bacterium]